MCANFAVTFLPVSLHTRRGRVREPPSIVLGCVVSRTRCSRELYDAAENYGGYLRAAGTKTTATMLLRLPKAAELLSFATFGASSMRRGASAPDVR